MSTDINLKDFIYELPEERIAKRPLENRSDSKLLLYKDGTVNKDIFRNLDTNIEENSTLFFNDTRVIPARLHFYKETGAHIEIFLLEPLLPTSDVPSAMLVKNRCTWKSMVGNLKKWKDGQVLDLVLDDKVRLRASIHDREKKLIDLSWNGDYSFVDILQLAGKLPLPPYIKRDLDESDKERYQTVYSKQEGAVAAPTAGLHFDSDVLKRLSKKNINTSYLTLHVSAGTFQPIKVDNVTDHRMHHEQVEVTRQNVSQLLNSENVIAVGTTSMRTLESLYWFGVDLINHGDAVFNVQKLRPYQNEPKLPSREDVCEAIIAYMDKHGLQKLSGSTEIFIFPGYDFKCCDGLITNFHLPGSTLILLVAAFIGSDWRKVYDYALEHKFRFLSYGDSSLLMRAN
ncbi:MAG: S-adenosylmethionine:tRNA ribosyltransferase-isomerase [Bacteroidota bacterium]